MGKIADEVRAMKDDSSRVLQLRTAGYRMDVEIVVDGGKDVTINGGGASLSFGVVGKFAFRVQKGSNLRLLNMSFDGQNTGSAVIVEASGTLQLDGVTVHRAGAGTNSAFSLGKGAKMLGNRCKFIDNVLSTHAVSGLSAGGVIQAIEGGAYVYCDGCEFVGNVAFLGGVVAMVKNGYMECRNCMFERNRAGGHGGVIFTENSEMKFSNCQFSHNNADKDGTYAHTHACTHPCTHIHALVSFNWSNVAFAVHIDSAL